MNQLAFVFGALGGLLCAAIAAVALLWRPRPRGQESAAGAAPSLDAVFAHWPTTALIVDPATNGIVAANPAGLKSLGYTQEEICRLRFTDLFTSESVDAAHLFEKLQEATTRAPFEMWQHGKDGSQRSVEATCYHAMLGERPVLAAAVHDVTVRRKVETQLLEKHQQLDHLANHDPLTGLPNRLFLAAHLPDAIEQAKKTGAVLAVLFLDLDRFKHVNDHRGHETGDKLLKTVAQRLRSTIRGEDLVVRMGGDEFVVVMKGVKNAAQVIDAAGRMNQALGAPMVVDGRTLVTTASIGVALYPRDGIDMGELLRHSDTAMYQAKDRGRNNFQLFSPGMDRRLKERIAIESSLRTALQCRQLDVHYQPIVEIETQRVVALEALLRWKHPNHGYVRPERFVTIAEEAGLIVPIGDFVLQRAIEDMARWRQAQGKLVPVAVNVSAVQLQRSNLADSISRLHEGVRIRARDAADRADRERGVRAARAALARSEPAGCDRQAARARRADRHRRLRHRLFEPVLPQALARRYTEGRPQLRARPGDRHERSGDRERHHRHGHATCTSRWSPKASRAGRSSRSCASSAAAMPQGYLFARLFSAEECLRFLSDQPLNLTERLPVLDRLEATDSGERVALRAAPTSRDGEPSVWRRQPADVREWAMSATSDVRSPRSTTASAMRGRGAHGPPPVLRLQQ